jgi:heat shock protein HslJ
VSKTELETVELEDGLRATFERAAASVPPSADLAGRATVSAQHAQRRTWLISGAAAAAVAVVAAVSFSLAGQSPSTPQPAAGNNSASAGSNAQAPAATAQAAVGTWRAVRLSGFTTLKAARPNDPTITFKDDGTWTGSDGCNGIGGTYSIGQHGEFTAKSGGQRLIGCDNVPHTAVLAAAKRIASDKTGLTFYAGDGREVARYARTR